jgi:hypothetical protein
VTTRLMIYGDFNCPFSALASVRADRLLDAGAHEINWRVIQHDTSIPAMGEPVVGDTASALVGEVETVLDLGVHDIQLHLVVPSVRSNAAASCDAFAAAGTPSPHHADTRSSGWLCVSRPGRARAPRSARGDAAVINVHAVLTEHTQGACD